MWKGNQNDIQNDYHFIVAARKWRIVVEKKNICKKQQTKCLRVILIPDFDPWMIRGLDDSTKGTMLPWTYIWDT